MAEGQWRLTEYLPKNSPKRGFFRKNLIPSVKPHGSHSFVAYLTFHFEPKDESGLPSAQDSDLLATLEEDAFVELEAYGLAVHVATAMKDGVKDLLFYTLDAKAFLKRLRNTEFCTIGLTLSAKLLLIQGGNTTRIFHNVGDNR
jgi:hypothetical protein